MSEQSAEKDAGVFVTKTDTTQWAVQCHTRTGDLFTGSPKTSRKEAVESGERLAAINGAEWWLVSRRVNVTIETAPWSYVMPPGVQS